MLASRRASAADEQGREVEKLPKGEITFNFWSIVCSCVCFLDGQREGSIQLRPMCMSLISSSPSAHASRDGGDRSSGVLPVVGWQPVELGERQSGGKAQRLNKVGAFGLCAIILTVD